MARIRRRHWQRLAESMDLDSKRALERVEELVAQMEPAIEALRDALDGVFEAEALGFVAAGIGAQVRRCERQLRGESA